MKCKYLSDEIKSNEWSIHIEKKENVKEILVHEKVNFRLYVDTYEGTEIIDKVAENEIKTSIIIFKEFDWWS